MNGQELHFANGEYWYALPITLALLLAGFGALSLWRRKVFERLGKSSLVSRLIQVSPTLRTVKRVLWACGLLLAVGAMLRPQFGMEETRLSGKGIDLVIALDISYSMLVPDVAPDRLTGSMMEVSELLDKMDGGRVALVPFAGIAYTQTPLTSDFEAVRLFLRDLTPADVPVPGSAIGRALNVALDALAADRKKKEDEEEKNDAEPVEVKPFGGSKHKAVLLITDGEDHGSQPMEIAAEAEKLNIRIYTVGVGSTVGDLVPKVDEEGEETADKILDPDSGDLVVSRLNEELLKDIAERTGGRYFHYSGLPVAGEIYKQIEQLEKREYAAELKKLARDRFQFLLLPAFLLLFLELFLGDRRRRE